MWAAANTAGPARSLEALPPAELHAAAELAFLRTRIARTLLIDATAPPLDEEAFRLGAALHNVLLLAHPDLGDDPADETRQRVGDTALALANVGPPRSAPSAVARHSLLGRVADIVQPERVVSHWLGTRRYLGRTPPGRMLALPQLRRVRLEEFRRPWLRDVGISSLARPAWHALSTANPLSEALDPLRLEPPLSFGRILPLLRFAPLVRLVAGRALEIGVLPAGAAFASALLRFAASRESPTGAAASPADVALGLGFLAHLLWLEMICGNEVDLPAAESAEFADLLLAAAEVDPRLVFPPDVSRESPVGRKLTQVLLRWRSEGQDRPRARQQAALGLARHAALHLQRPSTGALLPALNEPLSRDR
ncbi:MAG TPA: hypothetical protein VGG33_07690 [Polyangia bacterium]